MSEVASIPRPDAAIRPGKGLNIVLWIVQVLLAVMFGMAGLMKATTPFADLAQQMPWTVVMGEGMTRFIGVSELLGAVGLVLPSLTRIKPVLTAYAAAGLVIVMILAAGYHVIHAELGALPINFILGGLAAFVAWGRFRRAPITPRS